MPLIRGRKGSSLVASSPKRRRLDGAADPEVDRSPVERMSESVSDDPLYLMQRYLQSHLGSHANEIIILIVAMHRSMDFSLPELCDILHAYCDEAEVCTSDINNSFGDALVWMYGMDVCMLELSEIRIQGVDYLEFLLSDDNTFFRDLFLKGEPQIYITQLERIVSTGLLRNPSPRAAHRNQLHAQLANGVFRGCLMDKFTVAWIDCLFDQFRTSKYAEWVALTPAEMNHERIISWCDVARLANVNTPDVEEDHSLGRDVAAAQVEPQLVTESDHIAWPAYRRSVTRVSSLLSYWCEYHDIQDIMPDTVNRALACIEALLQFRPRSIPFTEDRHTLGLLMESILIFGDENLLPTLEYFLRTASPAFKFVHDALTKMPYKQQIHDARERFSTDQGRTSTPVELLNAMEYATTTYVKTQLLLSSSGLEQSRNQIQQTLDSVDYWPSMKGQVKLLGFKDDDDMAKLRALCAMPLRYFDSFSGVENNMVDHQTTAMQRMRSYIAQSAGVSEEHISSDLFIQIKLAGTSNSWTTSQWTEHLRQSGIGGVDIKSLDQALGEIARRFLYKHGKKYRWWYSKEKINGDTLAAAVGDVLIDGQPVGDVNILDIQVHGTPKREDTVFLWYEQTMRTELAINQFRQRFKQQLQDANITLTGPSHNPAPGVFDLQNRTVNASIKILARNGKHSDSTSDFLHANLSDDQMEQGSLHDLQTNATRTLCFLEPCSHGPHFAKLVTARSTQEGSTYVDGLQRNGNGFEEGTENESIEDEDADTDADFVDDEAEADAEDGEDRDEVGSSSRYASKSSKGKAAVRPGASNVVKAKKSRSNDELAAKVTRSLSASNAKPLSAKSYEGAYVCVSNELETAAYLQFTNKAHYRRWTCTPGFVLAFPEFYHLKRPSYRHFSGVAKVLAEIIRSGNIPKDYAHAAEKWPVKLDPSLEYVTADHPDYSFWQHRVAFLLYKLTQSNDEWLILSDREKRRALADARNQFRERMGFDSPEIDIADIKELPKWIYYLPDGTTIEQPGEAWNRALNALRQYYRMSATIKYKGGPARNTLKWFEVRYIKFWGRGDVFELAEAIVREYHPDWMDLIRQLVPANVPDMDI